MVSACTATRDSCKQLTGVEGVAEAESASLRPVSHLSEQSRGLAQHEEMRHRVRWVCFLRLASSPGAVCESAGRSSAADRYFGPHRLCAGFSADSEMTARHCAVPAFIELAKGDRPSQVMAAKGGLLVLPGPVLRSNLSLQQTTHLNVFSATQLALHLSVAKLGVFYSDRPPRQADVMYALSPCKAGPQIKDPAVRPLCALRFTAIRGINILRALLCQSSLAQQQRSPQQPVLRCKYPLCCRRPSCSARCCFVLQPRVSALASMGCA